MVATMNKTMVLWAAILVLLPACDDHPPARTQKKLALPVGENPLDRLLDKGPAKKPAHLVAHPTGLRFPAIAEGASARQQIGLANDGDTTLTLGPLRIAGPSADFQVAGDCQPGQSLAPGAACDVDVVFHPSAAGLVQAELVVDQGAAGPSLLLPLAGESRPVIVAAPPDENRARAALSFARQRQAAGLTIGAPPESPPSRFAGDPDYRDAGLPGVTSSFPVDRARVLTADRYIPAVLENTINSQLPGRAIAVVERPVFGESDRLVLIPAGSRVIGQYRAAGRYGQARLDIAWNRILRPDGGVINLAADSADVMGRQGVPGDLDSRLAEKYGSALLTSVIGAGADWALANNSTAVTSPLGGTTTVQSGRTLAANRLGNDTDRLAQHMVEDTVDIRPVLTVPQGTRLVIIPSEDIWLRDPDHLQAVTPPRGGRAGRLTGDGLIRELLPELIDLLAQSPALQKAAPQTTQAILQSTLLQQLRGGLAEDSASASLPAGNEGAANPAQGGDQGSANSVKAPTP